MSRTKLSPAVNRTTMVAELPVAAGTRSQSLAGAIAKYVGEGFRVELVAIGAGAVNQAVKAVAIARKMLEGHDQDTVVVPLFHEVTVDGLLRTGMKLVVVVAPKPRRG